MRRQAEPRLRADLTPDPTTPARSRIMSAIRGKGNQTTEVRLARLLRMAGIRGWRRHAALPGRPDFVFSGAKVAVFVDGCFWHGCRRCCRAPRKNTEFWVNKIAGNRRRDRRVTAELRARGWVVLRLWEHQLAEHPQTVVRRLVRALSYAKP